MPAGDASLKTAQVNQNAIDSNHGIYRDLLHRHVSTIDVGAAKAPTIRRSQVMQAITTIGLDIAKSVFQVHGVDSAGSDRALLVSHLRATSSPVSAICRKI